MFCWIPTKQKCKWNDKNKTNNFYWKFFEIVCPLRNKVFLISLLNLKKNKFTRYNNILYGSQSSLGPFTNNILNGPTIYQ